ncbi:Flavin-binding monooxygenase-like protein [Apiospora phragmitis]|uniref:Flavin-binding monooxygenase-like protein n=1 Tax=Apiospora phragmitis TaxID=2905665 RepID=A0ABR1X5W9_9PEZI
MDHPVREIDGIVTTLCEGSADDQKAILDDYFTPDAYFIHPLCRVPSFSGVDLPFLGRIDSRTFVGFIYQWYRILSPKIEIHVDSRVLDQQHNLLYLTMRQVFTLWFVPFSLWQSHAKLVTVLELAHLPVDEDGRPADANTIIPPGDKTARFRYFIKGQEDLYQANEWLKFIAPWGGSLTWVTGQLVSTIVCALCVLIFWPLTFLEPHGLKQSKI